MCEFVGRVCTLCKTTSLFSRAFKSSSYGSIGKLTIACGAAGEQVSMEREGEERKSEAQRTAR